MHSPERLCPVVLDAFCFLAFNLTDLLRHLSIKFIPLRLSFFQNHTGSILANLIEQTFVLINEVRNKQIFVECSHFPIDVCGFREILKFIQAIVQRTIIPCLHFFRGIKSLPKFLANSLVITIQAAEICNLICNAKHLLANVFIRKFVDSGELSYIPDLALVFCMAVYQRRNINTKLVVNVQQLHIGIFQGIMQ